MVDKFREFVGVEREKIEAKKQTVVKSERDRHMAELKKFHSDFKVSTIRRLKLTLLRSHCPFPKIFCPFCQKIPRNRKRSKPRLPMVL